MVRHVLKRIAAMLAIVALAGTTALAQQEDIGSPRSRAPLTILQINDVYSTLPIDDAGGLAIPEECAHP